MSHIAQQRLLFVVAAAFGLVVSLSIFSRMFAGIPDADASATMIATIDAGHVSAAPIVPAAPVAVAPPALPDPIDRPVEFVEDLKPAREYGGVHVLVLLVVAALARSLVKRIAPVEGSPPATGWRGKSVMVLSTIAVLVGSLLDLLLGSLTGIGFGAVAAAGGLATMNATNKTKAEDKNARSPVPPLSTVLLVIGLLVTSSCATVRHSGAAGAEAGLDCSAPALRATVDEAALLAKAFVLSKISGTGEVDAEGLRAAARSLKSEAMRCGLVAAIAAVAAAMEPQPTTRLMALPAQIDLRSLARDIATTEWGIAGPVIVGGSEI